MSWYPESPEDAYAAGMDHALRAKQGEGGIFGSVYNPPEKYREAYERAWKKHYK
ncbi:hypothetical protein GCM10007420_26010 [Glycocaulis albus]|jgi:hypothetical protein|uniref:Uncharacterized protein n=1 Tax=Glycocaulis albus TaxID=1382801 RepID=A0ABQ1Y0F0_9PROT|nr:hypothetical protein GCM10007420_26010 [Glycocaulis albus]